VSLIPRLILALVAGLFGVMMIGIAPPTDKAVFFYVFGAFCLAIAMACVTRGKVAQFFGSVVGAGTFLVGLWYAVSMLLGGEFVSGRRSEPSLLNALFFMAVFGAPGAAYVWHARFGFRKPRQLPPANLGKEGPPHEP
jgi:hypothetical protein